MTRYVERKLENLPRGVRCLRSKSVMKTFWASLAKAAVKLAVYAANHPDEVKLLVDVVKKK